MIRSGVNGCCDSPIFDAPSQMNLKSYSLVMRLFIAGFVLLVVNCCAFAITLDATTLDLPVGGFHKLQPSDGASGLKFSSSNEKVAVVYGNGCVIGLAPGDAEITVVSASGPAA